MNKFSFMFLCLIGCSSSDSTEAVRAVEDLGMTDVVVEDSSLLADFYGCGDDDGIAYEVTAVNPLKKNVKLTVCCGGPLSLKGCTVRSR